MNKIFMALILLVISIFQSAKADVIMDAYRAINDEFFNCMKNVEFKDSQLCYKQRVERYEEMGYHEGRWTVLTHAHKSYLNRLDFVAGKITKAQATAKEREFFSELNANIDIAIAYSQAYNARMNADISRALREFSKATANSPSITCRTNPDGFGGYRTVCQ